MRRGTLQVVMTVLSLCATSVALAGCTSDPGAPPPTTPPATSAAPSPSATPTPTPSPTPDAATPPARPDMSQVDTETAEAVAVYFLQLFPYVYATGDLSDWDLLSHPECIYCGSVRTGVEEMFAAGNHSEGGLFAIDEVTTTQISDDWWHVTIQAAQEPSTTVTSTGTVVEEFPESKAYRVDIAVVTAVDHLVIRGVDHAPLD